MRTSTTKLVRKDLIAHGHARARETPFAHDFDIFVHGRIYLHMDGFTCTCVFKTFSAVLSHFEWLQLKKILTQGVEQ